MVTFVVVTPAGTLIVTGEFDPLVTVKVAGEVRSVVMKIKSASISLPFGGPRESLLHVTIFGVGRYQYTS